MIINPMPKLIIFDLDGTFYPYSCIVKNNYDNAVRFLTKKFNYSSEYVCQLFTENNIFPFVSDKNASITEYILSIGIDLLEWNEYRNNNFIINNIPKSGENVVNVNTLINYSSQFITVLLSSSTKKKLHLLLEHLNIQPAIFSEIITPEDLNDPNIRKRFNKSDVFVSLSKKHLINYTEMLSIGDRYLTDIKPMIDLGGNGVLVKHPRDIDDVYFDLEKKDARMKDVQYKWYLYLSK